MKTKNIIFLCLAVLAIVVTYVLTNSAHAAGGAILAGGFAFSGASPQDKIQQVVDKGFGIKNISGQQGTTRIIYDTLELEANTKYLYFFKDCNTRAFPFTNLGSFGNKLEAGETLSVLFAQLNIFHISSDLKRKTILEITPAAYNDILRGEIQLQIANTTVMKPIRLLNFFSAWNKTVKSTTVNVFTFDSILVIPPMVDFTFIVQMDGYTIPEDGKDYLQLTVEGVGSILAPKRTL